MGLWDSHVLNIDRQRFRANNQYLYTQGYPYKAQYDYCKALTHNHWKHTEDGAFGCETAIVDDMIVSRDLLDSIVEIDFIRSACPNLDLNSAHVLDIGAGYGRFAHRYTTEFIESIVYCTDTIALSRELCIEYLSYRGCRRGIVIEPRDVAFLGDAIDLAVNIHSWSECTIDEIGFWLEWLTYIQVPYLFVKPHGPECWAWSPNGGPAQSFRPYIEQSGYALSSYWTGPECNPKTYLMFKRGE